MDREVALPAAPARHPPLEVWALGGVTCVSVPSCAARFPVPLCEGHCINNTLYCIIYQASGAHREKLSKPDNEGNKFLQFAQGQVRTASVWAALPSAASSWLCWMFLSKPLEESPLGHF